MTASIISRSGGGTISVNQGSQATASIVVKRAGNITLQSLTNVDSSDLQDGYTLIYDGEAGTFKTQPFQGNVTIEAVIDGGTF